MILCNRAAVASAESEEMAKNHFAIYLNIIRKHIEMKEILKKMYTRDFPSLEK